MIYFDNAATGGRKPESILSAVTSSIKVCANAGRSGHKLSLSCATLVQDCRNSLNSYFDGYGFDRVALTKNCTEALNIAIFGTLKQGDHAIVSPMEHNSVLRPLEQLKKAGIIEYDVAETTGEKDNVRIDVRSVQKLLRPKTRLVAVTSASNVNGEIPDLAKIKAVLPKNVLLLCDGAQGGGHLPIKMRRSGIDLLTLAGHKGLMGIQGSGALLFSKRVDPTPVLYGGTGSLSLSLDMPDFYPDALEAGTLAFPAVLSLLEGVRYLSLKEREISNFLLDLTEYCIHGLSSLCNFTVYSKPNPCGIVAVKHKTLQSEYVASVLSSQYDIAVRGGLHCAPLMHEALGTADVGLIRISFSHFNNRREIDVLLRALGEIQEL